MRRHLSLLTFVAGTIALASAPAFAQAVAVPTPGPAGTPVTFGTPATIGKPLPIAPAQPDAATVPTTNAHPKTPSKSFVQRHEVFVVGDYLIAPKVYNEFSAGYQYKKIASYQIRGAAEFNIGSLPVMLEGESRNEAYEHGTRTGLVTDCSTSAGIGDPGCVTRIGSGNGQAFVPAFVARDYDVDGRIGIKLLDPRIYLAGSYLFKSNNASVPGGYGVASGYGVGLEKLPDFEGPIGVYFGLYYYPNVTGRYQGLNYSRSEGLKYRIFRYEGGFTVTPHGSPFFLDLGIEGDRENAYAGSPSSETHIAPYAGIGLRPPNP